MGPDNAVTAQHGGTDWSSVGALYGEAARAYLVESQGLGRSSPSVESTVRTNSELVPERARDLFALVERLAGLRSLEGLSVLEVGSGFGALAAYLALEMRPTRLLAIDIRPDFVDAARRCARAAALDDRLSYEVADMIDLEPVGDGECDLIIANNAFPYLTEKRHMQTALETFHRVLRPGGHVIFFHANRWQARDPFTHDPVVHLLGPRTARAVSSVTGWKHSHGRVRLISPGQLKRRLRRAGFDQVKRGTPVRGGVETTFGSRFQAFYATAARKPD